MSNTSKRIGHDSHQQEGNGREKFQSSRLLRVLAAFDKASASALSLERARSVIARRKATSACWNPDVPKRRPSVFTLSVATTGALFLLAPIMGKTKRKKEKSWLIHVFFFTATSKKHYVFFFFYLVLWCRYCSLCCRKMLMRDAVAKY